MRILLVFISTIVSVHLCHAQYILNETALQSVNVYNFEDLNSNNLEFSPLPFNVGLLYISPEKKRSKYDRHINEGFFKIRYASDGDKPLNLNTINSQKQHIGPMSYDNHRGTLYYTVSQKGKKASRKARNQINTASFSNNVVIPQDRNIFNNTDYSIQHPALNSDGSEMILSANKVDAVGGFDLYHSTLSDSGWTMPIPIQGDVNSPYNEAFPVLWRDSILLYASNDPDGHGGLDIYVSTMSDGAWSEGVNLGASVNTISDDFSLILTDMRYGYFSSNRDGGAGKDDIYEVSFSEDLFLPKIIDSDFKKREEPYTAQINVVGSDRRIVTDALISLTPATNLNNGEANNVSIESQQGDNSQPSRSDENGTVSFVISPDLKYFLKVEHNDYEKFNLLIYGSDRIKEMELELTPKPPAREIDPIVNETPPSKSNVGFAPTDKVYVFDQLNYNYNSSKITSESTEQLNRLIQFMKDYPNAHVDLIGHTDSRGFAEFNMTLSLERAESVKKIITDSGVNANRVKTVGMGETALRNHCSNGVYCTESEHEYNRRTEIRVQY